jgi:hypothetical protein
LILMALRRLHTLALQRPGTPAYARAARRVRDLTAAYLREVAREE